MILLYLFAGIVVLNCSYLLLFSRFSNLPPTDNFSKTPYPISLIICAKNEEVHLKELIPLLLEQDHPNFEIIFINDASIDASLETMESFANKDPRIKIVDVKNNEAFWGNKKYALTLGIKKASNECMIFTDADCFPASKHWLKIMASQFSTKYQMVLGIGSYKRESGWLNKVIRFETTLTAIQYLSYAIAGIPYMGVGRNLGYTQKLFYDNRGFMLHMDLPSGDDDLFVNQAANKENTIVCIHNDSFTISDPKKTWKEWILQKRRHITTANRYRKKHQLLLGGYYFSSLMFWALAIVTLIQLNWIIPVIIISFRIIIYWFIVGKATLKLGQKDLVYYFPFLELFLILSQLSIFISNSISKPTKWK